MNIERVNSYNDKRFSKNVLLQHGGVLIDNEPYEVEIINNNSAIVRGKDPSLYFELINEFRFFAEHICTFYNEEKIKIIEYDKVEQFMIPIKKIQPSQFYVDKEKFLSISHFINKPCDVIIPLIKINNKYVSIDGHTRLRLAVEKGFNEVVGFITEAGDYIYDFVEEANKRKIYTPFDLIVIEHSEYEKLWNDFCNQYWQTK